MSSISGKFLKTLFQWLEINFLNLQIKPKKNPLPDVKISGVMPTL